MYIHFGSTFRVTDSRNSTYHTSHTGKVNVNINFPELESETEDERGSPYRSLLIPVKFNDSPLQSRLTQLSCDAVTESIRIRRVQTAIRGHVRGGFLKPLRERLGVDLR